MKYFLSVLMLVAFYTNINSQSCCCTSAGANYSILPNLNKHVIGIRYTFRNYFSEIQSLNPEIADSKNRQQLNTLELFGRFNLNKRLQFSTFIPVHFIYHRTNHTYQIVNGLGDMSFLLQYNALDPLRCTGKKSKHQLRFGAGTKLPSGDFDINESDMFNTNLQLGSGSLDFIFSAIYTYRFNGFGLSALSGYRYNTANPQGYRFGDRVQSSVQLFYIIEKAAVKLMPSVSFNYEHQFENRREGKILTYTGGDFLHTSVGFDIYYKQFAFSSSFIPALMNRLNWDGENKNRVNFEAGIFYNFLTNKK